MPVVVLPSFSAAREGGAVFTSFEPVPHGVAKYEDNMFNTCGICNDTVRFMARDIWQINLQCFFASNGPRRNSPIWAIWISSLPCKRLSKGNYSDWFQNTYLNIFNFFILLHSFEKQKRKDIIFKHCMLLRMLCCLGCTHLIVLYFLGFSCLNSVTPHCYSTNTLFLLLKYPVFLSWEYVSPALGNSLSHLRRGRSVEQESNPADLRSNH